jgi:hypothetical protein
MVSFIHVDLGENLFFVVKKLGLEVANLGGVQEDSEEVTKE